MYDVLVFVLQGTVAILAARRAPLCIDQDLNDSVMYVLGCVEPVYPLTSNSNRTVDKLSAALCEGLSHGRLQGVSMEKMPTEDDQ